MFTKYHEGQISISFDKCKDTKFPDMWESLGHTYFKEVIGTDVIKYAEWVREYKKRCADLTFHIRRLKALTKEHDRLFPKCGCMGYTPCTMAKETWMLHRLRREARSIWLLRNVGKKYYHKQEWSNVVLQRPVA